MNDGFEIDLLLEASNGGAARHVFDLYAGLRACGWPVKLILSPDRLDAVSAAEVEKIPYADVIMLPMHRNPHPLDFWAASQLARYFKSTGKRHLLHAHSTKAGIIGAAVQPWAAATVYTPHAYRGMDQSLSILKGKMIRSAEWFISRPYRTIIAVSPMEARYAASLGMAGSRIRYIPNGIDVEDINRRALSRRRVDRPAPALGFVGRMVPQKNPFLFVDTVRAAAAQCPGLQAIAIGDGPLLAAARARAASCGLAGMIDWRGNVPAVEALGEMDVLIHTSLYESMPYTLLEAAAAGVPVVAVNNDGSKAVFGDACPASIVSRGEAGEIARNALDITNSEALKTHHKTNLMKVAKAFSITQMVSRISQEYKTLFEQAEREVLDKAIIANEYSLLTKRVR